MNPPGWVLLDPGPLTLRDRELAIDRTCALAGNEYEWGVHVTIFAAAAKLTPEEVAVNAKAYVSAWKALR